jgi:ATP-dependent exoDNAse (exonuclease V) beta subunit
LQLPIDNGVEYLLELIKQHCIGKNNDLHRFIEWWKEHRHKLSAAAVNNPDAVQIMTIHKSKGLEFPVVIFPHFIEKSKPSPLWIDVPKDICELPTAYITVDANKENEALDSEDSDDLTEEISLEKKRRYLDDINNLYVACTRAASRMYFLQEKGGSAFNKMIDETLSNIFTEYKLTGTAEFGVQELHQTKQATAQPIHVPQLKGKEMLLPRLKLRSKLQRDTPEIIYGKLLHDCFSLLKTASDLDAVLETVLKGRADAGKHREKLTQDIQQVLTHTTAAEWFDGAASVYCEREMIASNGATLRPDRVVVFQNKVVVVDYKTGKESPNHSKQVNEYKQELERIYSMPIEGYLLYTDGPGIQPV